MTARIQFSDSHPHSRGPLPPGSCQFHSPQTMRAQGIPGARCARSLACKIKKHTSVVTTVTPESPGIPRAMVLTAYSRALPGDPVFLSPSPTRITPRKLDANLEASGPHDFAVRSRLAPKASVGLVPIHRNFGEGGIGAVRREAPPRPPHPAPRSVTIAIRPCYRGGTAGDIGVFRHFWKAEYFCEMGLTGFGDLPVGQDRIDRSAEIGFLAQAGRQIIRGPSVSDDTELLLQGIESAGIEGEARRVRPLPIPDREL
jgi:hypothetical protein